MQLSEQNWVVVLLTLVLWIWGLSRQQAKRKAKLQAEQERKAAKAAQPMPESEEQATPAWIPSEQPEGTYYTDDIYQFDSPVAAEEKQDERARVQAFKFKPADKEGETPAAIAREYAFVPLGEFTGFEPPMENIGVGEYFPQGLQTHGQKFLTPEELRRAIVTMEILSAPVSKRHRR